MVFGANLVGQEPWELRGTNEARLRALETNDTGWIALALLNSWVSYDATYGPPRYRRFKGVVYLQGLMKNGTTTPGTNIAQLPIGFRPSIGKIRVVTTSNDLLAQFDIASDGNLYIASGASAAWFSLNGLTFPADQ